MLKNSRRRKICSSALSSSSGSSNSPGSCRSSGPPELPTYPRYPIRLSSRWFRLPRSCGSFEFPDYSGSSACAESPTPSNPATSMPSVAPEFWVPDGPFGRGLRLAKYSEGRFLSATLRRRRRWISDFFCPYARNAQEAHVGMRISYPSMWRDRRRPDRKSALRVSSRNP